MRFAALMQIKTALALLALACALTASAAEVRLQRVPGAGLQPQAIVDAKGTLHLVYLKGDPKACDVFYVRRAAGKTEFSSPLRVNSQPGSAIAIGTIRGAQLALGKAGRVHIAWNGSSQAEPKPKTQSSPLLYTRLNDAGTAFEPQRNVINSTQHLDGGGTVAADAQGNVYVLWHSAPVDNKVGEAGRAVFLVRSKDEGKTFAAERMVNPDLSGACGCCGMRAFADSQGNLFALYRAAGGALNRDMTLLTSKNQGESFTSTTLHRWNIGQCPMSSEFFTESGGRVLAAWETAGPVQFAALNGAGQKAPVASTPTATVKGKYPVTAVNQAGETLLVWTEGTAWQRGGALAWQLFGTDGKPAGTAQRRDGIPVWGLAAAVAEPDGGFTVLY
jgi:hypothetical protein